MLKICLVFQKSEPHFVNKRYTCKKLCIEEQLKENKAMALD